MIVISVACITALILAGTICNVAALAFIWQKKRRTMKDKIVTALCLANLSQELLGYPIELYAAVKESLNDVECKSSGFAICFCTYASIAYFSILVIERYLAIIYPYKSCHWFSNRYIVSAFIFFPVAYAFILGILPIVGWDGYGKSRENSTYCGYNFAEESHKARNFFFVVIGFALVIPLSLTFVCYAYIIVELRKRVSTFTRQTGSASDLVRSSRKNVVEQFISSLLTTLIYILSWTPYMVVCFLFYHGKYVPLSFEYVAIYTSKSSTVTSPIVYCLVEKRFRRLLNLKEFRGTLKEKMRLTKYSL